MAAVAGISEASVRRIWHSHGLKPPRVETFRLSNDPRFAEKLENIVGLYLSCVSSIAKRPPTNSST